jgi:outer membrane protein OmpA-like peptidoglycan-associated protein
MKQLVVWILCILIMAALPSKGQIVIDTTNPIQFGIYAHGALTWHRTGDFTQLGNYAKPAVPFGNAWGDGVAFGALVNSPLSSIIQANQTTASIHLGLRIGFAIQSVALSAIENQRFIVAGAPVDGEIVHSINASFASFGADGLLEYTPQFHDNIRLHVGARIAWVYTATFRQREQVQIPGARAVFSNGSAIRRVIEDDIPFARGYESYGLAGLSYNIRIEKRFAVVPEVMVNFPLVPHTSTEQWRSWWIRAGISVKVTIPTIKPTVRDTLIQRDTLVNVLAELERDTTILLSIEHRTVVNETDDVRYEYVHRRELYQRQIPKRKEVERALITLKVFERLPDSTLAELDTLRCREIVWTDFHPLLPYIFFDYGSSTLSTRYELLTRMDAQRYTPEVSLDQMKTYYSVLNIYGLALRKNSSSILRIKGCVSRREQQQLPNWRQLADERAEVIAQYLHQTWGIEEWRLQRLPVGLPAKPSNERHDDGVSENQRVELYSNDDDLLKPVMIRDTALESAVTHLVIASKVLSPTPILRWNATVTQAERVLYKGSGDGELPAVLNVELNNERMRRLIRSSNSPLTVTVSVEQDGRGWQALSHEIPLSVETLEQRIARQQITEVDRYILMLFDAGRAEPSASSRATIDYVRKRIQPGSILSIIGSTDRTGSLAYNLELSKRRAKAVARLLSYPAAKVVGIGPDTVNYDNDLPEGRFHARTVKIEVEHPRPSRAYLEKPH